MSKVMETITFPGGTEPYQVRDGRIPENPGNYQYLVTDGSGQWGTADRLAYAKEELSDFISGTPFENIQFTGPSENTYANNPQFNWKNILSGKYTAIFDGANYPDIPYGSYKVNVGYDMDINWLGNPALLNREDWKAEGQNQDNGYPFAVFHICVDSSPMYETKLCSNDNAKHIISLYSQTEVVSPIDPKFLPEGEEWTFTLEDGSIVTKNVVVKA